MPSETIPVLLAVTAISLISVLGAVVLLGRGGVQKYLPTLVALAAGALLGDTFLHLLPHAVAEQGGFTSTIAYGVLGGLIGFFLIEGLIHWHHHGEDVHHHEPGEVHSFGWMNLIGDGLHNFIDGMLIASAWMVGGPQAGIATTIAIALHEGPQEFGDFAVLLHAGFSVKKAVVLNLLTALSAVLGAVVVLMMGEDHGLAQLLVPIAAGGFLYIACADLVPEIRKRAKGWGLLPIFLALMAGLALMIGVHEFAHDHEHHGSEHGAHGPREGILTPFHDASGEPVGRMEWKLDTDAGRLEVWITHGGGDGEPYDLPVKAGVMLTFPGLERSITLAVRDTVENLDADGYPTVRDGRTNYFVFPHGGPGGGADTAWLKDETFLEEAIATFGRDGVLYTSATFTLMPYDHEGGHGHTHGHSHK